MGAKQSKRSIDISGKEAESAGEVAATIAGGEGRVEQLADVDALKPQLNGDAHIHDTEEKQKDVDSVTPENEKDATTEKETKQQEEEKESAPLANGESEQKVENGESAVTPEEGKKPKKEKVKKKWSLRSISFSRKDKPKQEKKQKEEEPKTNGEPEKVPEETAEVAPEVPAVTETAEEAKTPEVKEDKTPETPVTEPITNGSSTPESPKVETPAVEEPAAPSPASEKPEPKVVTEPEQLPVNGLSLEEPAKESTENETKEDSKEEPAAETTEIVPEISVKKEVCVEQMSLIDSTPPPLPANPPPSSVASFAATTMAPELTDASLANTADNAISSPPDPIAKDNIEITSLEPENDLAVAQTDSNELSSPVKEVSEANSVSIAENAVDKEIEITVDSAIPVNNIVATAIENITINSETNDKPTNKETPKISEEEIDAPACEVAQSAEDNTDISCLQNAEPEMPSPPLEVPQEELLSDIAEPEMPSPPSEIMEDIDNEKNTLNIQSSLPDPPPSEPIEEHIIVEENKALEIDEQTLPSPPSELVESPVIEKVVLDVPTEVLQVSTIENSVDNEELPSMADAEIPSVDSIITEGNTVALNNVEALPSPPPPICDDIASDNQIGINSNHTSEAGEIFQVNAVLDNGDLEQNIKNKSKDSLGNLIESIECNGNIEKEKEIFDKEIVESKPQLDSKDSTNVEAQRLADEPAPPCQPPLAARQPQESLPVSDKLADLIPEIPEVPECIKETLQETTNDVAVAN